MIKQLQLLAHQRASSDGGRRAAAKLRRLLAPATTTTIKRRTAKLQSIRPLDGAKAKTPVKTPVKALDLDVSACPMQCDEGRRDSSDTSDVTMPPGPAALVSCLKGTRKCLALPTLQPSQRVSFDEMVGVRVYRRTLGGSGGIPSCGTVALGLGELLETTTEKLAVNRRKRDLEELIMPPPLRARLLKLAANGNMKPDDWNAINRDIADVQRKRLHSNTVDRSNPPLPGNAKQALLRARNLAEEVKSYAKAG